MADPRIGYRASSRTPTQERLLAIVLLGLFLALAVLLVGACSSQEAPPSATGNGSGAGGSVSGAGGSFTGGGGFGNTSCPTEDSCVPSCAVYSPGGWVAGYCDASGAFACPADTVRLSTCAPNACVQFTPTCCDDTTGADEPPPCGPDGLKQDCPAGTHADDTVASCIPASLGVTNCFELRDKPCNLEQQRCTQGAAGCTCTSTSGDGGALTWQCIVII